MKQVIMIPCGWCGAEFKTSDIRNHFPRCPKRPPSTEVTTRANWRLLMGKRVQEIQALMRFKYRAPESDINALAARLDWQDALAKSEWFQALELSWKHLEWIYATKIQPKPAEPRPGPRE